VVAQEGRPNHKKIFEESIITATYTFDVFSSLDGFGSHSGNGGGYWGKQGPELLDHRLDLYDQEQRMVFGANTYRAPRSWWSPNCVSTLTPQVCVRMLT